MRSSTAKNVAMRIKWLQSVKDRETTPTSSQRKAMVNIRNFCDLEVAQQFRKISYNTVKAFATHNDITGLFVPDKANHWEYFKSLMAEAVASLPSVTAPLPKPDLPGLKELYEQSLLDASLFSMAYFEIFRFLEGLAQPTGATPEEVAQKITNQLKVSTAKFSSMMGPSPESTNRKPLEIIRGGKAE